MAGNDEPGLGRDHDELRPIAGERSTRARVSVKSMTSGAEDMPTPGEDP
jgi:hypothetical protein